MAATAVTNITTNLVFLLYQTPKELIANLDGASFPLNGISAANSQFFYKFVDYNGDTIYANPAFDSVPDYTTPDILGSAPTTWLTDTPVCPTNSDGSVVTGQYTLYVIQRDASGVVTDTFTQNFTCEFQYERPTINLEPTIQVFNPPTLSVVDLTNYVIADPLTSALVSPTTNSREWSLQYPGSTGLEPVTSTGSSVQTNYLESGYYCATMSTTMLFYKFSTSNSICQMRVREIFSSSNDDIYVPDTSLGAMYCCLKHAEARYYASIGTQNEPMAEKRYVLACSYKTLINTAIQHGSYNDIVTYINRMKEVSGCDDCNCDDNNAAIPLTGWGTQTLNGRIDETATGSTATFPLSAANAARLKNLSYEDGDFIVYDSGTIIGNTGAGSTYTHNENTGYGVFNYTPSAGSIITFIIIKTS